jgi:hypothetical protein
MVDETGEPYAYTDDDPVNAIDPNGLDCGIFSFACSAYDSAAGGVKTAATDTGHILSDPNRWRNEANYLAGVGNGIVSTVTFGQVHISEPYCGELSWTYGLGTGIGVAGTVVGGGAAVGALTSAGEAGGESIDIAEDNVGHIFRDAPGHLADDTPANRQLLQDTASNPDNYIGTDSNGVSTYRETLPNGQQAWAEVWNGQITNGGVNDVPR